MTDEQRDLENLRLRQAELKIESYEFMQMVVNMTPEELATCGFKSLGAALESTVRDTIRKSHNLAKIHVAKYPD